MDKPDIVVIYNQCNDISHWKNQENPLEEDIAKESIPLYCWAKGPNEIIISSLICCIGQYYNSRVLQIGGMQIWKYWIMGGLKNLHINVWIRYNGGGGEG